MKALIKTVVDERQTIYKWGRKKYSVVDLCIPFADLKADKHFTEVYTRATEFYRPYNYELADITKGVGVLERFRSREEAEEYIRSL